MITMREARKLHRIDATHVVSVPAGYYDANGEMMHVKMRLSRVPFRKWVRRAWSLDLSTLNDRPSPKLARILGVK
jgi:hypothetical protein